jgi:tetratricopeptide (TPR) repeat protein
LTLQGSSEAVALFVDRARTSDPGFALTASNASVIATLVRRLDGLPLAIELAAARIRLLPPDALLARMDRQLPMLTGGGRDVPERQQTMRNTIGWSYHLLSPVEQAIFRRLSIFRAGCMLETAEKVLRVSGDLDDIAILDGLTALIDSSLLHRTMEEGLPPRLTMLATVREFGLEQLVEHGEEAAAREAAYRAWYIDLARKGEPWRGVETEVEDLDLLESEHDNLRSALDWLITQDRIQEAMDLAGSLWFFRWLRGHYAETRDQLESLLQHPLGQVRTVARAKALTGIGVVAFHQGDTQRSGDVLDEAIGILREAGDQRYLAMALMCSGVTYFRTGRIDMAEAQTRESLAIASSLRWDVAVQGAMCNLGLIAELLGREEEARCLMDEHVALARSSHDVWGLALGLSNKGARSMRDGDLDRAEEYLEEAKVLFTALKDKRDLPVTYWTLADIARQRGDLEKASDTMHQALNVAREIGDWPAYASCLTGLGWILNASGDTDVALRLVHEAAGIHREANDPLGLASSLDLVAEIAATEGDAARAAWCHGVVDRILEEHGVARTDMFPHEYESRIRFLKQALGEPGWRRHWTAGHNQDVEDALEISLSWEPPQSDGLPSDGLGGSSTASR